MGVAEGSGVAEASGGAEVSGGDDGGGGEEPSTDAGGGSESESAAGGNGAISLGLPRIAGGTGARSSWMGGAEVGGLAAVFFGLFFAFRSAIVAADCKAVSPTLARN